MRHCAPDCLWSLKVVCHHLLVGKAIMVNQCPDLLPLVIPMTMGRVSGFTMYLWPCLARHTHWSILTLAHTVTFTFVSCHEQAASRAAAPALQTRLQSRMSRLLQAMPPKVRAAPSIVRLQHNHNTSATRPFLSPFKTPRICLLMCLSVTSIGQPLPLRISQVLVRSCGRMIIHPGPAAIASQWTQHKWKQTWQL